jgi:hypothetical protein
MSAAGLASLFICHDAVHHDEYLRVQADTSYPPIERGLAWLAKSFSAQENPGKGPQYFHYYLFAVERVALASGYKHFGRHDWFAEGAAELLRTQGPDGGWDGLEDTSLALLFLARGLHPIVFNKLRYDGAWNSRPRDLAHLTRWIENTFETPVRWQVLDVSAPESEWHEAPVLYISGAAAPKLSPADIAKLRAYALAGGLILSEAAGNSPAFNLAMQDLYGKMFPEWALAPIETNHPVFSAQVPLARPVRLMGVSNGVRLLAIHSQADLSKAWQANAFADQEDIFRLAANVYFHATDAELLRRRGPVIPMPAEGKVPQPTRTIEVALLTGPGLEDPEPMAYERLADRMARDGAIKLTFSPPIPIASLPAEGYPVALMTGVGPFALGAAEVRALREFINAGGMVVADAAGGSEDFDKSAREHLLTLLQDVYAQVGRLPASSDVYNLPDLRIDTVAFRRPVRARYGDDRRPRLQAVTLDNRPVIVYSRDDITAGLVGYAGHNVRGYAPASALALMRNLLIYAATRDKPASPPLKGFIDVQWKDER